MGKSHSVGKIAVQASAAYDAGRAFPANFPSLSPASGMLQRGVSKQILFG